MKNSSDIEFNFCTFSQGIFIVICIATITALSNN